MAYLDVAGITSWHAHVYFNTNSRDVAWALREEVIARFGSIAEVGRFHERPVGPHPVWSYQIAFKRAHFADIVEWLALNRGTLDVLVHPNTDDELRDHRDHAIWLGLPHRLDLRVVGG
ncbi:DOPA 4,5-dioxygenase family protein [Crenobacter sp. SG2305]|uniref:DOPA 4,5-dioxygenase family protein n=1 Tax=Crenobacter oryzisoli TaxID=3056844 RepID=UPI0025AA9B22|nr:DOPA 4,5-dioxygenase family protein [Crenobacter sp. SG2305]MDN0084772.1 DOPA 4,5-dioxygenase family protein [Crenobacter sp. SG2305]